MSLHEFLINKALGEGLLDVVERDHSFLLRVRILGTWFAIASIAKEKVKSA
ncbi:hypothetical protein NKI86_31530 [Mesorhizobium sp. M0320]|uniref:hypothetical protein n=1 Tax=unclassified Mesorhizobium TaxID=325217 RepID=UPI003338FC87